ncbi:MAG: hypothetical protein JW892_02075 [Anaerolineae bacterium]|nr:hypothetical protein [Anaerolineae bacterium]
MIENGLVEACYEIRFQGHLDQQRAQHFAGLTIMLLTNGETLLSGPIADQAALHGILARIRDLGVVLLEVKRTPTNKPVTY